MKFDVTIMNPPYNRNLHLDIIKDAIGFSNDVVNISPTGWLHDMAAVFGLKDSTFQRYEGDVAKHIREYKEVTAKECNDLFGIGTFEHNSITALDNSTHDLYKTVWKTSAYKLEDVFRSAVADFAIKEHNNIKAQLDGPRTPWFARMSDIHGHPGSKDVADIVTPNKDFVFTEGPQRKVYFSTEEERDNFFNFLHTDFMRYLNLLTRQGQHIHLEFLPWLGDYTKEWTDEMLFEFFSISKNSQEKIKEVMDEYAR